VQVLTAHAADASPVVVTGNGGVSTDSAIGALSTFVTNANIVNALEGDAFGQTKTDRSYSRPSRKGDRTTRRLRLEVVTATTDAISAGGKPQDSSSCTLLNGGCRMNQRLASKRIRSRSVVLHRCTASARVSGAQKSALGAHSVVRVAPAVAHLHLGGGCGGAYVRTSRPFPSS